MIRRRKRGIRRRMNAILGRIAKERGQLNEKKVLDAFVGFENRTFLVPVWFHGISMGTEEEDCAGIDLKVSTDVGLIALQVKSSYTGLHKFMTHPAYDGDIAVVVIRPKDTSQTIRDKVYLFIGKARVRRLNRR